MNVLAARSKKRSMAANWRCTIRRSQVPSLACYLQAICLCALASRVGVFVIECQVVSRKATPKAIGNYVMGKGRSDGFRASPKINAYGRISAWSFVTCSRAARKVRMGT